MSKVFPSFDIPLYDPIAKGLVEFTHHFPLKILQNSLIAIINAKVAINGAAIMLVKELSGESGTNVSSLFEESIEIPPMVHDILTKLPPLNEKTTQKEKKK